MGQTPQDRAAASKPAHPSTPTRTTLFGPPPRVDRDEMLDTPKLPRDDLAATLRDIALMNRFLGGTHAVLTALGPLLDAAAATKQSETSPIRILDIGTGSADIPRAIARAASSGRYPAIRHRALMLRATDSNPRVLAIARKRTPRPAFPSIDTEEADARSLPYPDGSFDIVLCSQTLHHFCPEEAVALLKEMSRIASTGILVNDLIRSRRAALLIRLWMLGTFANRVTRHDAPISILRSYTIAEYTALAHSAGLQNVTVRRVPLFRTVLVHRKQG